MKNILLVLALLPLGAYAQEATDNSALYGTWSWTRAENRCTEVYDFRPDGVAYVVSGAERTENSYTLSSKTGTTGRRRLVMTTTKYLAGKDCAEQNQDPTGKVATSYLLFLPGHKQFIMCADEISDACFGPLFKLNP